MAADQVSQAKRSKEIALDDGLSSETQLDIIEDIADISTDLGSYADVEDICQGPLLKQRNLYKVGIVQEVL